MIIYLLKMSLCSAVLLLFYRVVLEREKMLRFNRFYLLGSLILSLVLPLIPLEILLQNPVFPPPPDALAASQTSGVHAYPVQLLPQMDGPENFSWVGLLGVVYLAVGAWLLVRFGKNLSMLVSRIRSHAIEKYEGLNLVLLDVPTVPHSFLNNVFVSKIDFLDETLEREIMEHERAHAQQLHSLDILFIEFLKVIFWFNPALNFYRNAIAMNHEFLADASVTKNLLDISYYQRLLLQKSANPAHLPFISKFNYSFIKKRFVMMHKQTSPARAALAQFSVLPLLAIAFFAFSDVTLAQIAPPPPPVEMAPPPPPVERGSLAVVDEYNALISKYASQQKDGYISLAHPSIEDGKRLVTLREAMSKEQADTLRFKLFYSSLSPKKTLSKEEFEKYKNPNTYGVWLNDKKIVNTALRSYKSSDLYEIYVSRVYPNAQPKTGYKYKYQVGLMTEVDYDAYRKEYLSKPHFRLVRRDQPRQ